MLNLSRRGDLIEAAANLARNGPLQLDPAIIDKWRDAFAKTAIGTARRP